MFVETVNKYQKKVLLWTLLISRWRTFRTLQKLKHLFLFLPPGAPTYNDGGGNSTW